ncbi:F-box protein At4g02733-like isoform X2 [Asparagus officinalis]|uniref:F-box protein At4g02733-like isoform X2 n=1 Tax=Asparagus officinalis TaxID=4686 RepID=UPI00098E4148|nr:F-box protein At4g02733-like isoform X2 [Asparagus officinalis]
MDRLLGSFLALSDPAVSIDLSLERIVDSRCNEPDKDRAIEAAMRVASALLESAKRSARRRASKHNSNSWPLPFDLTVKVFSMLDTQSLCHAAAACSLFNKCATDPLCYADIDLTAIVPKVNNTVVSTMIQRAGRNLQSLKLGILPTPSSLSEFARCMSYSSRNLMGAPSLSRNERRLRQGRESSVLTRSCLLALSLDGGAAGALLRRLHLYNIDKMDSHALCTALFACQSLLDLEVVGLHVELKRTLDAVSTSCHSIERLFIESSDAGRDDSLNSAACTDLVNGCPHVRSLALRGFKLHDSKVRTLVKGFRCLRVADFSTSFSITGIFLRSLGSGAYAQALEVLILRDCLHLKEVEISNFLLAILGGDCKLLRYLDVSNKDGLSSEEDWNERCYNPSTEILRVREARPGLCLLANFPPDGSFMDIEQANDSDISSGSSLDICNGELSPQYASPLNSSYSSDQGSGNEGFHDVNFAYYDGDGFDEPEFQYA